MLPRVPAPEPVTAGEPAVIDLDVGPPGPVEPGTAVRRRGVRRWRAPVAAVAVASALLVGGAAPPPPPRLVPVGAAVVDGTLAALLDGDVLYAVSGRPGVAGRVVTAFSAAQRRELWSVPYPGPRNGIAALTRRGDVLLVSGSARAGGGPGTHALDARTGATLWSLPYEVQPGPAGTGFAVQWIFGSDPPPASAAGLHSSISPGVGFTTPPQRSVVRVVDLSDGRQRWSATEPGAVTAEPGPAPGTLVIAAGARVEVRDAATGTVRHRRAVTVPAGEPVAWRTAGTVLLAQHRGADGPALTAFDSRLRALWTRTGADGARPRRCGALICVESADGLGVLEPASGRRIWGIARPVALTGYDGAALETTVLFPPLSLDAAAADIPLAPLRLRAADTGAPRAELTDWDAVSRPVADRPLVLSRVRPGTGWELAVLPWGSAAVRPLGTAGRQVAQCQASDTVIACRTGATRVQIWRYRA